MNKHICSLGNMFIWLTDYYRFKDLTQEGEAIVSPSFPVHWTPSEQSGCWD